MADHALQDIVVKNSVGKTWETARHEWVITNYYVLERGEYADCVAKHKGLRECFTIKNKKNGNELDPVGNKCIESFDDESLNTDMIGFKAEQRMTTVSLNNVTYNSLREAEVLTQTTVAWFHDNDYLTEEDAQFIKAMIRSKKKRDKNIELLNKTLQKLHHLVMCEKGKLTGKTRKGYNVNIADNMHPEWYNALRPVSDTTRVVCDHLNDRLAAGATLAPAPQNIFRALSHPIDHTKVLVLGQDPYPSPGHAVGLAFSADRSVRPVPKSLANIYTELHDDLGITPAETPDLTSWDTQGVMLLNRVLTTEVGSTAAHRGLGWETVTDRIIQVLLDRHDAGAPLVAVLWGRDARRSSSLMRAHDVPVIESVHPSPLSAHRGFFGSRPFSRVNQALREQGADRIDWTVR